jgi:hypothetical protein
MKQPTPSMTESRRLSHPTTTGSNQLRLKIFVVFLVGVISIVRLLGQQLAVFQMPALSFDPSFERVDTDTGTIPTIRNYYEAPIRNWGCHRNETPLIFVHIGKAGGGKVRARLAAAAQDYGRGQQWKRSNADAHYYPVGDTDTNTDTNTNTNNSSEEEKSRAYFCNGMYKHHRFPNSTFFTESQAGFLPCHATTPIGMSLACPETAKRTGLVSRCRGCRSLLSKTCHTVYVGHTYLGSELHYLPTKYLQQWWADHWGVLSEHKKNSESSLSSMDDQIIRQGFKRLMPMDKQWCPTQRQARPKNLENSYDVYNECSSTLSTRYDAVFDRFWRQRQQMMADGVAADADTDADTDTDTDIYAPTDYSSLYASLPLHRITMLREPYSWLLSKFNWHKLPELGYKCDGDLTNNSANNNIGGDTDDAIGWIQTYCVTYLLHLCGDDCANRFDAGVAASLEELERQSANNLRRSFSVVGLLNETEAFYDMVDGRINYVDMSLNPEVEGNAHPSVTEPTPETERCRAVYQSFEFRERLKERVPIVAVIERLYEFGVKVNRHQMDELETCSTTAT